VSVRGKPGGALGAAVASRLDHWARTCPDQPCVTCVPRDGAARVFSYRELAARVHALAAEWSSRFEPGQTVALLPGNDILSVTAILAAVKLAVPCLFLNPHDPLPRLRSILREHPVAGVFRSPLASEHTRELARTLEAGGKQTRTDCTGAAAAPDPARPAFLFGTSGSTAASKLVVQPHRALVSNAEAVRCHHGLDEHTVLLGGLPLHHVNGVHFTLMAPVYAGAQVVLPEEIWPFGYPALIDTYRPHLASVVPTVLEALLMAAPRWRPPESLRYFVSAAAPLTTSLINRIVAAYGRRVIQAYGLSETTNFATTVPVDLPDEIYREVALDATIPSVGTAVTECQVEVLAPDGRAVAEGEHGEICMRGANIMLGYAGQPELTEQAFASGWFHSGDLGFWRTAADGRRYFYLIGRDKNVAKVRGETVSLEEIERTLLSVDAVRDAACVTEPHQTWGEQIIALVALRDNETGDIDSVRAAVSTLLSPAALPARWQLLADIPRTTTGKLRRAELCELAGNGGQP
jgi:acyl-CoA synthetase (AMP-forming)/AMP-acid ligase II